MFLKIFFFQFLDRKMNGLSKLESARKKPFDYTEIAYREAVSKLKYLLAESYSFKSLPRFVHFFIFKSDINFKLESKFKFKLFI